MKNNNLDYIKNTIKEPLIKTTKIKKCKSVSDYKRKQ